MAAIPKEKWGRDHFSVLAYIETRCVDANGRPSPPCMRTGNEYPTRLRDGELHNHDDWACANDLEDEDLLINKGTGACPVYRMTNKGMAACSLYRTWKAGGGYWAAFPYDEVLEAINNTTNKDTTNVD